MEHPVPTLEVGVRFPSMKQLRIACKRVALLDNFEYSTKKSDKRRYTIECSSSEACPWRLHASSLTSDSNNSEIVEIKTFVGEHTCRGVHSTRHKQAGASFISSAIEARVKDQPEYRAKDILKDVRREHGLTVSYSTVWRAKEQALANINGTHESVYSELPTYCADILRTNPGSTAILECSGHRFLRMFVCYAASAKGFAYCRPVLGLDGCHLKGKFQGILLTATAVDANGSLFPLAYAVVSAENDDNWRWFINILRGVITEHVPTYLAPGTLAFISDRQKGLLEAIDTLFPGSPHGYCLRHLYENLHKQFKHPALREWLWKAARATSAEIFNDCMDKMKGIAPNSVAWLLLHAPPKHWAEFYFPGHRYGHITSNIAESLNASILEAREKPILAMFEQLRHHLIQWFNVRREIDIDMDGILVSKVANEIKSVLAFGARRYRSLGVTNDVYEIFSTEKQRNYVVQLQVRKCTCWGWQTSGIPCSHALAVSLWREDDPQTYANDFFSLDAYRGTYANVIFPPNVDAADRVEEYMELLNSESNDDEAVLPPSTRRLPGRPKKRRIRSAIEGGDRVKRVFRCSRCSSTGHSKRTCTAAIQ